MMLDSKQFPGFRYFENGNAFSAEEGGMRYLLEPQKRPNPDNPDSKKKLLVLQVWIWPGPWDKPHTDPALFHSREFAGSPAGLAEAVAWLQEQYHTKAALWADIPSVLDCEPWHEKTEQEMEAEEAPF